jgi:hypothetical protein
MGQKTDSMNGSSEPTPEQMRANLSQTRAEISETLDELHGKLNPQVLKEQALEQLEDAKLKIKAELKEDFEAVKLKLREEITEAKTALHDATIGRVETMYHHAEDKISQTGHSMVDTVKTNPVPFALIGAGLAWLFIGGRRSHAPRLLSSGRDRSLSDYGVPGYEPDYVEGDAGLSRAFDGSEAGIAARARGAMGKVGEKLGDVAHTTTESVSTAAHKVGELGSRAGSSIAEVATGAAQSVGHFAREAGTSVSQAARKSGRVAREQAHRLERRSVDAFHASPVAVGAAVLAAGAAIGFAIPRTRREEELLGDARSRVLEKAESFAHDAIEKVEDAARHFASGPSNGTSTSSTSSTSSSTPSSSTPSSGGSTPPTGY